MAAEMNEESDLDRLLRDLENDPDYVVERALLRRRKARLAALPYEAIIDGRWGPVSGPTTHFVTYREKWLSRREFAQARRRDTVRRRAMRRKGLVPPKADRWKDYA
jgi:hypothetical protein